jgi:flagellar hook-associated protein 3
MESRSALQKAENENIDLQLKIASGKEVSKPSDDPLRFVTAERFKATIRAREQTLRNVSDAKRHLENNENSVRNVMDLLQRVRILMVRSGNDTNTTADLQLTARELRQTLDTLIQFANSDGVDGRIFGGSRNDANPFEPVRDANGEITDVIYRGNTTPSRRQIGEGETIDVNFVGSEIFQVDPQTSVSNQGVADPAAPLSATLGASNPEGHFTVQGERVYFNTAVDSLNTIAARINDKSPSALADVVQDGNDFRLRIRPRNEEMLFIGDEGAGRFLERLGLIDGTANAPANTGPGQTPAAASNLNFFNVIIDSIGNLERGETAGIRDERLAEIDRGLLRLDRLIGEVGGMAARLSTTEEREKDFVILAKKVISENEDLDYGKAISDLRLAQMKLETAVGAAQNLPNQNLLKFM